MPSYEPKIVLDHVMEPSRTIPITHHPEVLVIGAGSGGWSAAVAAARAGRDVLLVDMESALGGTSTIAMMNLFGGPYEFYQGLMREVTDELARRDAAKPGPLTPFDGEAYKSLLFEVAEAAGVKLLLNTWFSHSVTDDDGNVVGVVVENKRGRQAITAQVVIDATGDGDVAASAGAEHVLGRTGDNRMRPMTLLFRLGNIDCEKLVSWAKANPEQFKKDPNSHIVDDERQLYRLHGFFGLVTEAREQGLVPPDVHYLRFEYVWPGKNIALVNTTRVYDVSGLSAEDMTRAAIEARRQIGALVEFIRARVPGCSNAFIVDTASRLGIRETRHILGDYVLQEQDLVEDRQFPDGLIRDHRRMVPGAEVHSPDGNEGGAGDLLEREVERRLYGYNLPYRCFLPRGLGSILVSGRAFSATHEADGWTRDIPGIVLVGQALGVVAAVAVEQDCTLRDVDLDDVRHRLRAQGVDAPDGACRLEYEPAPATIGNVRSGRTDR